MNSARDLCGESDPRKGGGKRVRTPVHLCPPPWRTSAEKEGRSHHQHPARAARRLAVRGGDTRGAASLRFSVADAENPSCPASNAEFRGSPTPQWRGLRPLREKRWTSKACHPSMSPPLLKRVTPIRRHMLAPRRQKSLIDPAPPEAVALLDRLLHRCHIVNIQGNSYRMRRHAELSIEIHPLANRLDSGSPAATEALS